MKDIFGYQNDDNIIRPFFNNTAFVMGKSTFVINDICDYTEFTITCGIIVLVNLHLQNELLTFLKYMEVQNIMHSA